MRGLLTIGAFVSCLALPVPAAGFLLVSTDDHIPTHWEQQCVPWKLHEAGSQDLGMDGSHEALRLATLTWEDVEESFIRFSDHGLTSSKAIGVGGSEKQNVVLWHEENGWPYALRVVGLTSLTFDSKTGQIVDADIEMNGADYAFADDGDPDAYDAQQSLTHELGHLLGLDHSENPDAVMYADSLPGELHKRVLHQDDIEGLSTSHPVGAAPGLDGCLVPEVLQTNSEAEGCAGATGSLDGAWWGLLVVIMLGVRRRRGATTVVGLLGLALCVAPPANAGQPYTTPDGTPIFWPEDTMHYRIHPDLPDGLEAGAVQEATDRGFDAWEKIACQPLVLDAEPAATCPGEDPEDGVNCIRWRDRAELWAWPGHLVAITLVHYWEDTGVIEDVDMDINAFNFTWSTELECQEEHHDLMATITHEAGHFLGLDHSLEGDATMNAATTEGDCQKRSLAEDDEATFCGTYENRPDVTNPEPAGDLSIVELDAGGDTASAESQDGPSGSTGPGDDCQGCRGATATPWFSLWALTAWLRSRRRPGRAPPPSPAR